MPSISIRRSSDSVASDIPNVPTPIREFTLVNDDARHFLRTTNKQYDLVVFALIDSLTLQSSFSGVRLESYMFTEESFRAVRDRLKPDGVLVIYNYFRERWLVDRLANTAARGVWRRAASPRARSQRLPGRHAGWTACRVASRRCAHSRSRHAVRPIGRGRVRRARINATRASNQPPTIGRSCICAIAMCPAHYLAALALIVVVSVVAVGAALRGHRGQWSWHFFLLGAGFMLLETKSIIQFALLWGSTWVVASLAIASVLVMALAANFVIIAMGCHTSVARRRDVAGSAGRSTTSCPSGAWRSRAVRTSRCSMPC